MGRLYVKDFQPGDRVRTTLLVLSRRLVPFRDPTRGNFLHLSLADRTGTVQGRVWDRAEELYAMVSDEDLVDVQGVVEEYQGSLQLIVEKLKKVPEEKVDPFDFVPSTEKDPEAMMAELDEIIGSLSNRHLLALLDGWFNAEPLRGQFMLAPAAKQIHHSYLGGLLEHTLEVVHLADALVGLYPSLDRDLLITAAILHDVGKLREFKYRRAIDYTDRGRLIGHTVLGYELVMNRVRELEGFPSSLAMHLGHLILTHHGEMDYGAPIRPQTLEAAALHHADLTSGKVKQFAQILAGCADGERWTAYNRLLGRFLYKG